MKKMVVRLVCEKHKLVSASFTKNSILHRRKKALLHEPKIFKWVHAPGLRGFVGLTTSMRKHKITRARNDRVAVENTSLVQNEKEVGSLNFSKEQH